MGQGTFGQVVMCRVQRTGESVAVKVIKRQPAFTMQADKEIYTLTMVSFASCITEKSVNNQFSTALA